MLVWGAGVQSNNCRQTAASCAKLGLDCHLVLSRGSHGDEVQGNLLLDHLLGATYEIVDAVIGPELDDLIAQAAGRFRAQGRKVYNWDRDLVRSRAAVSYTLCMAELVEQLDGQSVVPAAIYVCSAGSTGAGLALGKAALGVQGPLLNMLPIHWPWDEAEDMCRLANEAAELIDLPNRLTPDEIIVEDGFIGPGYGVPTPECMEAIRKRFPGHSNLQVVRGDICDLALIPSLRQLRVDTVICTNVLEHIADDRLAIRHMAEVLKDRRGRLILLVPAHPALYGTLDRAAGHFRRYEPRQVRSLLEENGLASESVRHMNILGGLGWWFNSRVLRDPDLNSRSMNQQIVWFDRLAVPILERVERVLRLPFGLSLIAVGRVP